MNEVIIRKAKIMFDKVSPEFVQAGIQLGLTMLMAVLRVLAEEGYRTIRSQVLEVLICGFLGLAAFTLCKAMSLDENWAFTIGIMIGHFGSIRVRILAMKIINREIK